MKLYIIITSVALVYFVIVNDVNNCEALRAAVRKCAEVIIMIIMVSFGNYHDKASSVFVTLNFCCCSSLSK